MFFEIFQSLSLTTGAGGLFDFGATLPLVAIQFLILMFVLNTILYNPLLTVMNERNEYVVSNLTKSAKLIAETKEIKGIVQKKFLPTSEKIIFGDPPNKIKEDTGDDRKLEKIKIDSIEKQQPSISEESILKENDSSDKIRSGQKTDLHKRLKISEATDISDQSNLLRAIYDRRKSRDRRSDYIRRSDFERRIKQFFDYTSPDRRTNNLRRKIEDRRFVENRRFENDRRLEGEGKTIKRSNQKFNLND